MHKRTSKRRWLARFLQGKWVPSIALVNWPQLARRIGQYRIVYACNIDAIRLNKD